MFAFPILILLITINDLHASNQTDATLNTYQDSIKTNKTDYIIIQNELFNPIYGGYSLYDLNDSMEFYLDFDLLNQRLNSNYLFHNPLSEQWRINEELLKYVKFNKDLAIKTDLGVFGKALGNAKILTALILAILHLTKYRKTLY